MNFEVHETVNGIQKLIRKVGGISTSEFAGVIKEDIWQNFVKSRSPSGAGLHPLSRWRIAQKTARHFPIPSKILVASGQLSEATYVKNLKNESHVLVNARRSRTADNPKGRVPTNIQLLKWNMNRPVWGLSERVEKLLKKRLDIIAKK